MVDVRSEIWTDCGKACPRCNEALVSPDCSEFVSERLVLNHWCCSGCGVRFDSEWTPKPNGSFVDWELVFPPLLVA
jgi:transcription elongation factor Elf1